MDSIELTGAGLTATELAVIAGGAPVRLAAAARERMAASRAVIDRAVAERKPVYGVTTGLGPRAVEALPEAELEAFALRTVRGRAHSAGADLPMRACRAALAVRLNTLLIGAAGVRPDLAQRLADWLNLGLAPAIREAGSTGAADLMWGGDFGLAVVGEGRVWSPDGMILPAADALHAAGIAAWTPGPREGLALVSHSSVSGALAALLAHNAAAAFDRVQTAAALSMEGFRANLSALDPELLALRPQAGQDAAAARLRDLLADGDLTRPGAARRLQDPLSIRNIPQVHGAAHAALTALRDAAEAEINGASDNPGVMISRGDVASHGGYLTPHLFVTLTGLGQAWTQMAAAQLSRIGRLLSGRFTDLPTGLTAAGAEGAGLGPVMKTVEALWAEIAHAAAPPATYPGFSADGLEDVSVSTGLAAKSLGRMLAAQSRLTAIELIVAAQAVRLREIGDGLAPALRPVMAHLQAVSPPFNEDRPLGDEIEAVARAFGGQSPD